MTEDLQTYILQEPTGETEEFVGGGPKDAALKIAKQEAELADTEADAREQKTEIRFREAGTDVVSVYNVWCWRSSSDNDESLNTAGEYKGRFTQN